MKSPQEMRIAAYMRVSRDDLHLENQKPCIEGRCTQEGYDPKKIIWFVEEISSGKERPVKNGIMDSCREGMFDVVVFARFDRWARSMFELVSNVEELVNLKVRVIIPRNGIDFGAGDDNTLSSTNRLILQMFGAFAEFERNLIRERTKDGVARARTWGKIVGRHPVGCGCGLVPEKGGRHNGPIKPIRDEKNQIIGWNPLPKDPPISEKAVDSDFVAENGSPPPSL